MKKLKMKILFLMSGPGMKFKFRRIKLINNDSDAADSHLKINTFQQEAAAAAMEQNMNKNGREGNKVCTVVS